MLDSDVLTDGGGAILQSLESMGVQYEVKKLPCDATIGWMRNRVEYVAEESGQVMICLYHLFVMIDTCEIRPVRFGGIFVMTLA